MPPAALKCFTATQAVGVGAMPISSGVPPAAQIPLKTAEANDGPVGRVSRATMILPFPRYFVCTYAIAEHKDEVNVLSTMPRIPETDMIGSISKI